MKKLARIFLCLTLSLCVFSNYALAGYSSSDYDEDFDDLSENENSQENSDNDSPDEDSDDELGENYNDTKEGPDSISTDEWTEEDDERCETMFDDDVPADWDSDLLESSPWEDKETPINQDAYVKDPGDEYELYEQDIERSLMELDDYEYDLNMEDLDKPLMSNQQILDSDDKQLIEIERDLIKLNDEAYELDIEDMEDELYNDEHIIIIPENCLDGWCKPQPKPNKYAPYNGFWDSWWNDPKCTISDRTIEVATVAGVAIGAIGVGIALYDIYDSYCKLHAPKDEETPKFVPSGHERHLASLNHLEERIEATEKTVKPGDKSMSVLTNDLKLIDSPPTTSQDALVQSLVDSGYVNAKTGEVLSPRSRRGSRFRGKGRGRGRGGGAPPIISSSSLDSEDFPF